jgi:hypothetical protein
MSVHIERPADQVRSVGHRVEAGPVTAQRPFGDTHAVVPYAQDASFIRAAETDLDSTRSAVCHGIVHRLLRNAKQVPLNFSIRPRNLIGGVEAAGNTKLMRDVQRQVFEPCGETDLMQTYRAEAARQAARFADGLVQQLGNFSGSSRRIGVGSD